MIELLKMSSQTQNSSLREINLREAQKWVSQIVPFHQILTSITQTDTQGLIESFTLSCSTVGAGGGWTFIWVKHGLNHLLLPMRVIFSDFN